MTADENRTRPEGGRRPLIRTESALEWDITVNYRLCRGCVIVMTD